MELVQQFAPSLLLLHVLCPFVTAILLGCLLGHSPRIVHAVVVCVSLGMAVSALALLGCVAWGDNTGLLAADELFVRIPLPGWTGQPSAVTQLVWGLSYETAAFACLLPWIALSCQLFSNDGLLPVARTLANLLLLGSLGLFAVAQDAGSLLSAAALTILLLALQIARYGIEDKRAAAAQFFNLQMIGLLLFAAGLAVDLSGDSMARSAPHGLPGPTTAVLTDLAEDLRNSTQQHPAAAELWNSYRTVPAGLLLAGVFLMGAGFPFQVWLSEVSAAASLGERLWIVGWVKAVLFVGLRHLHQIDPTALQEFAWWGMMVSVPGALFVASLLFSQAYLPRIQSSALAWTQQMTLMAVFAASRDFDQWVMPLLLSHTAASVLLTLVLTTISERYRSVEISSFQGLSSRNSWLLPALTVCVLSLTMTPLGLGLMHSWLITLTLQGGEAFWSLNFRLLYLLADVLAVAGLARVTRQLCLGPLRLPEMAPGLRERTQLPPSTVNLDVTRPQASVIFLWGILAVAIATAVPLNWWMQAGRESRRARAEDGVFSQSLVSQQVAEF